MVRALYACLARALSSAWGGGVEAQHQPSHRLYRCRRCGVFVCVCRRCDRGQWYCPGECARVSRRESLRVAGRRYQRSRRGAQHHAARQRRYRLRRACQKIVTHLGSAAKSVGCTVALDVPEIPDCLSMSATSVAGWRCDFCGAGVPDPDPAVGSSGSGTASTDAALRAAAQTQPREERSLLVSLSEIGQQLPVVVIEETPSFILIDGYKRVRALKRLARDTVRATCWQVAEAEALLLERSLRRGSEDALDQAWLLAELQERYQWSLEELARRFERSKSWVSGRLALLQALPASIQEQIRAGTIECARGDEVSGAARARERGGGAGLGHGDDAAEADLPTGRARCTPAGKPAPSAPAS